MPIRTKRTEEELRKASHHLHYEFSMLISITQAFASGIASGGWLVNALLESFVIHFRTLLDFFYPPDNSKPDDVLASDYFDNSEDWAKIRPHLSDTLNRYKIRAHKEIAHLTYARLDVTPEIKGWAFLEIAREMEQLMDLFLKHIPKNRLEELWHRP